MWQSRASPRHFQGATVLEHTSSNGVCVHVQLSFSLLILAGSALLLTTFFPTGSDGVYVVPNAGDLVRGSTARLEVLDGAAVWPNQADIVPIGVLPSEGPGNVSVLTASGFFVSPFK
jgi:hypothetical protein